MTCLSIKILTLQDRPDKYLSIDQNSHDLIRIFDSGNTRHWFARFGYDHVYAGGHFL